MDGGSAHGVRVCPFSSMHHVGLPSLLMNVDAILSPVSTPREAKGSLNRTLSTVVPSPATTPRVTPRPQSGPVTARAACLVALTLRSWRGSRQLVQVSSLARSNHGLPPLTVVKRSRFDERCMLVVGGLAVPLGYLDTPWRDRSVSVELSEADPIVMEERELYVKILSAAKAALACGSAPLSAQEVLLLVGKGQTNITVLLSGAVLLDELRRVVH